MARFPLDQFAKQYLAELLAPLGELDVWFAPKPQPTAKSPLLGLLRRFAYSPCLLEPFRNAVTPTEIRNCLLKLFEFHDKLQREARWDEECIQEANLPRLWILLPSASVALLDGFRARIDEYNWPQGVYFLGGFLKTAVVAIDQLPRTQETLWLRILGRGVTQQQAIDELAALSAAHPLRSNVIQLLAIWRINMETKRTLTEEDRELTRNLTPIYLLWRKETVQEGQRFVVENLLKFRFGSLDDELSAIIKPVLELPPEEFTPLLMQLSREELLTQFRG